jgi:hypothetical protein
VLGRPLLVKSALGEPVASGKLAKVAARRRDRDIQRVRLVDDTGGAHSRPPSRLAALPREDAQREGYVEFVDVVVLRARPAPIATDVKRPGSSVAHLLHAVAVGVGFAGLERKSATLARPR